VIGALRRGALAPLLLLAGCASLAPPAAPVITGRLSVQVAEHAGQPARGLNAAFDLRGTDEAGELRLSSVLGPQVAAARWSAGKASLSTAEGERRFSDLDALAREALGESLPLRALPDWLQGRPWPGAPSVALADGFEQLGWTLSLARWAEGFLTATRSAAPTVTLRARLDRP